MLTLKQLTPKIAGVRKSTKAMRANIQEIVIHAAANAYVSGDVTAFTKLIDATRGVDQKAIMLWIREFGFATYNTDLGAYKLNKTMRKNADFADGDAVVDYLTNEAPDWYDFQPSKNDTGKEVNANKRLESLFKDMQKSDNVIKVDFKAAQDTIDAITQLMAKAAS
jgi:hypothetical protein